VGVCNGVQDQGTALSAATVAWWETDAHDCVRAWLVVGPGSPPLTEQAWVTQAALTVGGWAVASSVPLWDLGPELASRLGEPAGPGRPGLHSVAFAGDGSPLPGPASAELYDACRTRALTLIAERAQDDLVAREPRNSGIVLLHLGVDGGTLTLDLAPAIDEPAWRGRPIDVDLDSLGPVHGDPEFGTRTVALMGLETTLPCARLRFATADGTRPATIRLTLPKPHLPGAPDPVVDLSLDAGDGADR
jgi:hypothetical protein